MYADTGLLFPYLQGFTQELYHHPHPLQEELLCRLQASNVPLLLHDNAGSNMVHTTTITDYDLGGEGDLFKAPEPIIEDPVIALDPMTAAISMMSGCDDVMSAEVIKIVDIDTMPNEQLLNEVFYECEKDLLAQSAVEDAFSELSDVKVPALQIGGDEIIQNSDTVEDEPKQKNVYSACQTSLEDACSELSDVKIPALQIEEKIRNDEVVGDGPLQKSVSSGCLTSPDWINGGYMKPNFLDFRGMDLSVVFGMRRAYSEGDIQTLRDGTLGQVNANVIHPPFERLSTIGDFKTEERRQKLSRYRKKKTKRNFGRKIKYACRKALADSQPRVRGRFAKTEECEIAKASK